MKLIDGAKINYGFQQSRKITFTIKPKFSTDLNKLTVNEWLTVHGFKNVNDIHHIIYPKSYEYGDFEWSYHVFPLYTAIDIQKPNLKLIESLLLEGADPNFQTKKSLGPILNIVLMNSNSWNNDTIELLTLLIEYGADVNVKDVSDGSTPLHRAALAWPSCFAEEIIELLIMIGANVTAKDVTGQTPYGNVLLSYAWPYRTNLPHPGKILKMLDPMLKNTGNRE